MDIQARAIFKRISIVATLAAVGPKNPGICRLTAITTHPAVGDKVRIWSGIPTSDWSSRLPEIGGSEFAGGSESFALDAHGHLNWQSIRNNAHVGSRELTVTGK